MFCANGNDCVRSGVGFSDFEFRLCGQRTQRTDCGALRRRILSHLPSSAPGIPPSAPGSMAVLSHPPRVQRETTNGRSGNTPVGAGRDRSVSAPDLPRKIACESPQREAVPCIRLNGCWQSHLRDDCEQARNQASGSPHCNTGNQSSLPGGGGVPLPIERALADHPSARHDHPRAARAPDQRVNWNEVIPRPVSPPCRMPRPLGLYCR